MSNLVKADPGGLQPDPLDRIERGMALLKALDCLDDRAKMILSSAVLNQIAGSRSNSSGDEMLTLSDAFMKYTDATPKEATALATKNGRDVKAVYFKMHNEYPPTHKQLVNGKNVDVCDYTSSFLEQFREDLEDLVTAHRS